MKHYCVAWHRDCPEYMVAVTASQTLFPRDWTATVSMRKHTIMQIIDFIPE